MRNLILLTIVTFLTSCTTEINANLDYAHTSLGYRNSGQLADGQIFIWDKVDNTLRDLRSPATLTVLSKRPPTTLIAKQVKGFDLSVSSKIPQEVKAEATAKIQNNTEFLAENASRVTNIGVYSAVSTAYKNLSATGTDSYRAWDITSLQSNRARYKLVILTDPVFADKEESKINKDIESTFSANIAGKSEGSYKIRIPNNVTASCSGKQSICYINVAVLNVYVNSNGNLDYSPAKMSADDTIKLSSALRNL